MKTNTPGSAGNLGGATMNSGRAGRTGGPSAGGGGRGSARSGGTRATGRPAPVKKATVKKTTAPAGTASPSGGRAPAKRTAKKTAAPSTAPSTNAAPKGPKRGSSTAPSTGQAPAKKTTAKKTTAKKTTAAPAPAPAATPQGRMARADAAVQARASAFGGRARTTFKRVPGSSQAAGMARRTGTPSVKAYNKLPGGKKTKIAVAGGVSLFGAGMYADRNKGKPGSGKPKNGDTKKMGGRMATYRNGTWYAS